MHSRSVNPLLSGAAVALALSACGPKASPPSSATSETASEVAPTSTAASTEDASTPATDAAAKGDGSTLFEYEQGKDKVRFIPPNVVLFRRAYYGPKSCETKLSSDTNMWTGPDVVSAFRDDEVQQALKSDTTYFVEGAKAKLTADGHSGSIAWVSRCSDCPPEPPGVKHLREVMQTVTTNRTAVCP